MNKHKCWDEANQELDKNWYGHIHLKFKNKQEIKVKYKITDLPKFDTQIEKRHTSKPD